MSYEEGAIKYMVNSIIFNYFPMYIFGGAVITSFQLLTGLGTGNFINIFIKTLFPHPSSLIINPLVGSPIAAIKWYLSSVKTR